MAMPRRSDAVSPRAKSPSPIIVSVTGRSAPSNIILSASSVRALNLREECQMLVRDVLKSKSSDVHQIIMTATLSAAAGLMSSSGIGALVVEDPAGKMNGLISERELTAAVARWGSDAPHRKVQDIMVKEPLSVHPTDTLNVVTTAMTHLRARHALVIDEGKLVGILSIGDVLKFRLDEKIQENLVLQDIARWRTAA